MKIIMKHLHNTLYEYESLATYDELNLRYLNDNGFDDLVTLLPELPGKTLCFTSSKKSGEKLTEILRLKGIATEFINADNKAGQALATAKSLSNNQKFESKILIATSVLDVGVSIHDREVRNIVIDTIEKNSFLQMLGRIRTDIQALNIFICSRSFEYFDHWIERIIMPNLDLINELLRLNGSSFVARALELMKKPDLIVPVYWYEGTLHMNEFSVQRWNDLYTDCSKIKEGLQNDPEFFIKKQLEWLGQKETFSISNYIAKDVQKIKKKNLALKILEKSENARRGNLSKEQISEFLSNIKPEIRDLDRSRIRSNTIISVKCFNEICRLEDLPFYIDQKLDSNERKQKYELKILELNHNDISA